MLFLGLGYYFFQKAIFLHSENGEETIPDREVTLQDEDTLFYGEFLIVRTELLAGPGPRRYGVVISRNATTPYRHPETVDQKEYIEMGLASLLGNANQQLIIQQFSGGTRCCWNSWVLELGDSIRPLYRSSDFRELGNEISFEDLDGDGRAELSQSILLFEYFDRLDNTRSQLPTAYFQYSDVKRRYVLANMTFSQFLENKAEEAGLLVKNFADTAELRLYGDPDGQFLSLVLGATLEYIYAGKRDRGWTFFDRWYTLADKPEIRRKIQLLLSSSGLFEELYPR
ncbi:MAG: hypothetical protein HY562_13015 [Ignavibacteriales bacterium]|nr:hypothetical protein [Ignavibacteriales bacterium]